MKRALYLSLVSVLILVGLLGAVSCGSSSTTTSAASPSTGTQAQPTSGGATGPSAAVTIKDKAFSPETLTVSVGTTVTWTNKDPMSHIVSARDRLFMSDLLGEGKSFSYTFTTAGTYEYYCTIHPTMAGKVIVQ
jgi:plastocyanin